MTLARLCLTCSIPTTRGTRCPLCEAGHQARTVFACDEPVAGQQYVVLREDWADGDPPTRTIHEWRPVG